MLLRTLLLSLPDSSEGWENSWRPWAGDGGKREVGSSCEEITKGERRTERRMRHFGARDSAALKQVASCSANPTPLAKIQKN